MKLISIFVFSFCALLWFSSCSQANTNFNNATVVDEKTQPITSSAANNITEDVPEKEHPTMQETSVRKKGAAQVFPANAAPAARKADLVKTGKYGCVASKYMNGEYEFIPRGSVILKDDESYSYQGFEEPSTGKFETDAAGNILFHGGYLKDGKAEKTDREGKYLLTFPANPDNRWTMSFAD